MTIHDPFIPNTAINNLTSTSPTHRLNPIDRIRANGMGDYISLPQLVVCGDQSAGKSSVLEGITGIPFPRQDAATKLQLHGTGSITDGPAFAADVLRIEVVGDTGLYLTVVDLPNHISVANEEQTEADIEMVYSLVNTYLESSRTIILAVIQANKDIANQGIIHRARRHDWDEKRIVGIITMPDLINRGIEGRIALLARNQDTTKLKLSWKAVSHLQIANASIRYTILDSEPESKRRQLNVSKEYDRWIKEVVADEERKKLLSNEKCQPITYNYYYTNNIQKARQEPLKTSIGTSIKSIMEEDWNRKFHISNTSIDAEKLLAAMQKRVVVTMDKQAFAEAAAELARYYKVVLKTFVDNICRQVFERHVIAELPNVFSPATVIGFGNGDLVRIASEQPCQTERRAKLKRLVEGLRESLKELGR
ncbi:uncharacterized protein K452DRAFT_312175 [Aplosporella prunicola CBS 121167]|uniref:GED domain-containing protein n=1 Tax=Aplosporella prunicola CBS 121167 TaxID=1176127 RepID=A0A6A6B3L9_9PEZI|nr:uncharacterized protein K452DRAFT_312175 [Aplosporella prunicola CBS 121167]KAF2137804.1 hypothetical protein K452DRAFT_312175 [Aplosporella prunicola CBS 121167]